MDKESKILIVDDSSLFRKYLRSLMEGNPRLRVAGEARDGREALDLIPKVRPDVLVLDVNMPVMDGLTALKHIMIKNPTPTLMFSSLTKAGARITFDSLKCGAVDFIEKPSSLRDVNLEAQRWEILHKIEAAAAVKVGKIRYVKARPRDHESMGDQTRKPEYVFAIGASEGGIGSLLRLVPGLSPEVCASYVTVLYEEPAHVDVFCDYLDEHSEIRVKRAKNGDFLRPGVCYIASGKEYVTLVGSRSQKGLALHVAPSPFPKRRGSVNMLMFSLAEIMEQHAVGVLLSGKGKDGAEGLGEISRLGGVCIALDPASCLSEDMVRNAIDERVVHFIYQDSEMPQRINANFATELFA